MTERIRFHDFELRPDSGELFRHRQPVKLQQQPTRVLELLARRAGQVVSRDELGKAIWGEEYYVDSDQGLNYCVRQIRIALGDQADTPRYVETVPRRGYRFVAPVKTLEVPAAGLGPGRWTAFAGPAQRRAVWWLTGMAAGLVVIVGMRSAVHTKAEPRGAGVPGLGIASPSEDLPPKAHEVYLQGIYLSEKPLVVERARARERFERVIELVPGFAPAHAAWARLMMTLHQPPLEVLPSVEAAAERALELDPELAEAHVVRGKVRMLYHHDWQGAEAAFRRALELDPSSVEGHLGYGHLLAALGRHEEALRRVHRARELDPASALVSADLGWYYYFARRYAEAEKHSRETLKIERGNIWALLCLVLTALERGDDAGALTFARDQIAAEVAAGRAAPLETDIGTLEDYWRARLSIYDGWRSQGFYVSPGADAGIYLALGDTERALELLDQGCLERSLPILLAVDRRYDPLRGDERFVRLLACAG